MNNDVLKRTEIVVKVERLAVFKKLVGLLERINCYGIGWYRVR